MSGKEFKIYQDNVRNFESNRIWGVKSETNSLEPYMTFKEAEKCCELLNKQQDIIQSLKEENRKLRNIHLSIDLNYSYGYGKYLADVRVIDNK